MYSSLFMQSLLRKKHSDPQLEEKTCSSFSVTLVCFDLHGLTVLSWVLSVRNCCTHC